MSTNERSVISDQRSGGTAAVPERKLEEVFRHADPLPAPVIEPVVRAVRLVADRVADAAPPEMAPERITPGSLSSWSDAEFGRGSP